LQCGVGRLWGVCAPPRPPPNTHTHLGHHACIDAVEDAGHPAKEGGLEGANVVHQQLGVAPPVSDGAAEVEEELLGGPGNGGEGEGQGEVGGWFWVSGWGLERGGGLRRRGRVRLGGIASCCTGNLEHKRTGLQLEKKGGANAVRW
jgi:hypothetical protein